MPKFARALILVTGGFALFLLRGDALPQQRNVRGNGPDLAPISGVVLNDADGRPIAGATVHYRGDGGDGGNGVETNPPSLQGEVTTGPDGKYTLPKLPFGYFSVRVSAPGYLAAKKHIQTLPVNYNPGPPTPIPPSVCLANTGKPTCGNLPEMPNGVFRLRLDPLHLQSMSSAAPAASAPPFTMYGGRNYVAAAFSAGGARFGVVTFDRAGQKDGGSKLRCVVWTYDLTSRALAGADLSGSPLLLDKAHLDTPPGFCSGSILWFDDGLYILRVRLDAQPPFARKGIEAYKMQNSVLSPVGEQGLPTAVQDWVSAHSEQNVPLPPGGERTGDGRFGVDWVDDGGRGGCGPLVVTTTRTGKTRTLTSDCPGLMGHQFLLDRERDVLVYTPATDNRPHPFESIVSLDLNSGLKRTFDLPVMNYGPQFIAYANLDGGAIRVAYTIDGDCDYATSDYSQPGQPDGELGNTPNQHSVCFITIPPPESVPSNSAASISAHP